MISFSTARRAKKKKYGSILKELVSKAHNGTRLVRVETGRKNFDTLILLEESAQPQPAVVSVQAPAECSDEGKRVVVEKDSGSETKDQFKDCLKYFNTLIPSEESAVAPQPAAECFYEEKRVISVEKHGRSWRNLIFADGSEKKKQFKAHDLKNFDTLIPLEESAVSAQPAVASVQNPADKGKRVVAIEKHGGSWRTLTFADGTKKKLQMTKLDEAEVQRLLPIK